MGKIAIWLLLIHYYVVYSITCASRENARDCEVSQVFSVCSRLVQPLLSVTCAIPCIKCLFVSVLFNLCNAIYPDISYVHV